MQSIGSYWGSEFTFEEIREAREKGRLLSMELELSKICNFRCIYCYTEAGNPLKDELMLEEIKNVVDQAADLGARKIIILGGGEPLLYPHLLEVVDHILARNLKVDIFTNGSMITEDLARRLFERRVAIVIKMNSFRKEIQDYLAGKKGAFEEIQKGLQALLKAGYPSDDHLLGIASIVCRQNYEEIPKMWIWARERGIIPYFEIMTVQGRAMKHPELEVPSEELQVLFEKLSEIDATRFGYHWEPLPPLIASRCRRHEYSCTVTSVGDVIPCPGVDVKVGNIREKTLAEILRESPVIKALRNIRETIKGACRKCKHKEVCYGCRGSAYQVIGDYLAEDPICWLKRV